MPPSQHYKLGPSKAKQWTLCTASVPYIDANRDRLPPNGSKYADEGTKAHEYGEQVLRGTLSLDKVPEDFRPHVQTYVQACQALVTPHAWVAIERQVPLFYAPDGFGTVDFLCVGASGIHVRDLKYGAGVLVESQYNKQLAIYAWSAICDLVDAGMYEFPDNTRVTIHAIQPRHHEWVDEPWETTIGELMEFCANEIAPAAQRILGGADDLEFHASPETCQFCEAKGFCPERAKAFESLPSSVNPLEHFDNLEAPEVSQLSDEQLVSIYRNSKAVAAFTADVEKFLLERALAGQPLDGTKLVTGREGNRKWSDESLADSALAALGLGLADRYKQTLKPVTEIEKVLKEKQIDADVKNLIDRAPGKPTLAMASDKRPAIESPVSVFDDNSTSATTDEE